MLGDKIFRVALLVSITVHSALITPWPCLDSLFETFKTPVEKSVEVNYLEIKVIPKPKIEEKTVSQIPTKGKILKDKQEPKVAKAEKPILVTKPATKTEPVKLEPQKPKVEVSSQQPEGVYVDYYNLIRKKIRFTLLKMYRSYLNEGEIFLKFTLRSNGALDKVNILDGKSTPSQELRDITIRALQKSSPFPPFPQELNESRIDFEVVIAFRK